MGNQYLEKIKKFGLKKTIARLFGDIVYSVAHPIQKNHVFKNCAIEKNKILFTSVPAFSDNAKILYEYLIRQYPEKHYQFVWLIGRDDEMPQIPDPNVKIVRKGTLYHRGLPYHTFKEIYTCQYIFFTHRSPVQECGIRKGQTVVNLWHGCGYKDKEETAQKWIEMNPCQMALVPGKVFIETKSKFWGCDKSIIQPIGYPRYDLLKTESPNAKQLAAELKGNAEKLIVWMPTFRKSAKTDYPEANIQSQYDLPLLQSDEQLKQLNAFCAEHHMILCIKRHPLQVKYSCESMSLSHICFISNETFVSHQAELYSFLPYTDALISDYSSIAIDYLLLNRPMAFALEDFEAYQKARGFVFKDPLHYMPGNHLYHYEDLQKFLSEISQGIDSHAQERLQIMEEVHNPCENYCERVWQAVSQLSASN